MAASVARRPVHAPWSTGWGGGRGRRARGRWGTGRACPAGGRARWSRRAVQGVGAGQAGLVAGRRAACGCGSSRGLLAAGGFAPSVRAWAALLWIGWEKRAGALVTGAPRRGARSGRARRCVREVACGRRGRTRSPFGPAVVPGRRLPGPGARPGVPVECLGLVDRCRVYSVPRWVGWK